MFNLIVPSYANICKLIIKLFKKMQTGQREVNTLNVRD